MRSVLIAGFVSALTVLLAAQAPSRSPEVRAFVTVDAPVFALTHVRVIDGTGAPAKPDQTIVVSGGRIQAIGDAGSVSVPSGATVIDKRGYTVIPGLVGMHDHMFKVYMDITRAELAAAIDEAHARGLKVTGHLCSIGFREAAALGIDDLEHGLLADTEFVPGKQPDVCPPGAARTGSLMALDMNGPELQQTIRDLVARHVAVTSTLPVFEISVPGRPPFRQAVLDAMSTDSRLRYLSVHARIAAQKDPPIATTFRKEMQFEYAFAKAGGLLLAGLDPTGYGGVVPGFGDQREVELLVEAGFTPVEAIRIATYNGAQYLGELDRIGSLAAGKQADMVLIEGDPSADIADIERVETVFKDGVGYDSAKLIESAKGKV